MLSSRPYLLRALYEWILDNDLTPHLLVNADLKGVNVPSGFIEDGKIILNINPAAVQDIVLGNEKISFKGRFGGKPIPVEFPVTAALAIYAAENGKGLIFPEEEGPVATKDKSNKSHLKVIK